MQTDLDAGISSHVYFVTRGVENVLGSGVSGGAGGVVDCWYQVESSADDGYNTPVERT